MLKTIWLRVVQSLYDHLLIYVG